MRHLSNKQLGIFAILLIMIVLVIELVSARPSGEQTSAPASLPPLTAPEAQQLQQMPTFQYLVSYTNSGFEPSTLKVKKGDVVRFTNNSKQQLWVASIGQGANQIYPGTSNCGGSAFDSCTAIAPGDFWQFALTQSGTYDFQNNVDPSKTGTITITVQ